MQDKGYGADLPIMIVEDEPDVLESLELVLDSGGFSRIIPCRDSRHLLNIMEKQSDIEVILLDLLMPYVKGWELLPVLSEKYPHIPVIVVTALDELETAVSCMKAGAFDYLVKPIETMRLLTCVRRAFEKRSAHRENMALKRQILSDAPEHPKAFEKIITRNNNMMAIFKYIEAVAPSPEPVLITGETGVGKELVARAVHRVSLVKGPFVGVNIAGLDDLNFSDTLFGHRKGAFTGADTAREGLVKKSADGTLFLDEISDLSRKSQIKLLRLLQEKEYFQLGSDLPLKSRARILAASNLDLEDLIEKNSFRRDLYFRLKTHQITLPPLRRRMEDLPLLTDHFIKTACRRMNLALCDTPPGLINLLRGYGFPGNVRELESMIFDSVSGSGNGEISLERIEKWIAKSPSHSTGGTTFTTGPDTLFTNADPLPTLKQATQELVAEAMRRAGNNQTVACRFLGISQPALSKRLKNMDPPGS